MHRFRAIHTAAVLVAVVTVTSMGPAAAGGPTSALLSVPGEGKTASLYYTDHAYERLADLVGMESRGGVGAVDRSGLSHAKGPGVTVTWLIHDVTPWRVDHIYLEGNGAPWIATQLLGEFAGTGDGAVVWHQPRSGAELAALLDRLGVGEASRDAGAFTGVPGAPVQPPAEPVSDESARVEPSATRVGIADISWGLGGLVIGALATLLWMRPRRRTAEQTDTSPADGHDAGDSALLVP